MRNFYSIKIVFLSIFLMMLSTSLSGAVIIDFDGLAGTDMPGNDGFYPPYTTVFRFGSTSTVEGFNFSAPTHYYTGYTASDPSHDFGNYAYNGTDFLEATYVLAISEMNSNPFTLNSLDLATWYDNDPSYRADNQYRITGSLAGGGSISQTLTLDNVYNASDNDGNDFNHFTLTGFTNITSFTIDATVFNSYTTFALDNLEVNAAPVPEPTTMLLLSSGLIGLVGFRRKFKKS